MRPASNLPNLSSNQECQIFAESRFILAWVLKICDLGSLTFQTQSVHVNALKNWALVIKSLLYVTINAFKICQYRCSKEGFLLIYTSLFIMSLDVQNNSALIEICKKILNTRAEPSASRSTFCTIYDHCKIYDNIEQGQIILAHHLKG